MTSELDIILLGVTFPRNEHGRLVPVGPPGADLRSAVAERMDLVKTRLAGGPSLDGGNRWGTCDTCGCSMGAVCNGECCRPSGGRTSSIEKKHERCCHETKADGVTRAGDMHRRYKAHGSNRTGICWLCECALQKIIAAGEWPPKTSGPKSASGAEATVGSLPLKTRAPWEI